MHGRPQLHAVVRGMQVPERDGMATRASIGNERLGGRTVGEGPLASTSIGQVHEARLHGGTRVAVKVQKPGLAEQIETDIAVLAQLAGQLERRWAGARRYDFGALVHEFAWTLRAELDCVREGRNAERFAAQFAGSLLVRVPRVFWDCTERHVLTMEFVSGIRIDDLAALTATGTDTCKVARTSARVLLESVFLHGFSTPTRTPATSWCSPTAASCSTASPRLSTGWRASIVGAAIIISERLR